MNRSTELFQLLKYLLVHWCPHLDEILAAVIVRLVLGKQIPVIAVDRENDHYATDESVLRIGYGGGWADEHPLKNKDSGITSAILVARFLGVFDRFMAILKAAAEVDRNASDRKTSIASLLKALNQSVGNERAIEWAIKGVTALLQWSDSGKEMPTKEFQKERFEASALVAYGLFLKRKGGSLTEETKLALKSAWRNEVAVASGTQGLLQIATIAAMMDEVSASEWLLVAVEGIFQRQVWFQQAVEMVSRADQARIPSLPWTWKLEKKRNTNKKLRDTFYGLTVTYVYSDNPECVRAFRSDKTRAFEYKDESGKTIRVGVGRWDDRSLHILIQEGQFGIQIFTDKEALLPVGGLGALLRHFELQRQGKNPDPKKLHMLIGDGSFEDIPQWYVDSSGRFVMCGSFTNPIPLKSPLRTRLSLNEILTILEHSFQGEGVAQGFVKNSSLVRRTTSQGKVLPNRVLA